MSVFDVPITGLTATAYTVRTDTEEADGTLSWNSTTLMLVQVVAGDRVGTGWTYAPTACVTVVEDLLADLVRAADPFAINRIHDRMARAVRNAGRPGIAACAISAVDVALWDLKARLLDLPLHRLLGGTRASRSTVPADSPTTALRNSTSSFPSGCTDNTFRA